MLNAWSKEQKTGIITLVILLAAIIIVVQVVHHRPHELALLDEQKDTTSTAYLAKGDVEGTMEVFEISLHAFDPNTADSLTLLTLGFRPYQIKGMMRYRTKGGCYRQRADLLKISGMSDSMYFALKPYVQIDTLRLKRERIERWKQDSLHRDSLYRLERDSFPKDTLHYTHKPKKDTIIELNSADTTTLQLIPGIGRYRASKIVQYRERLGGYCFVKQLQDSEMEIYGRPIADSTLQYFIVNLDSVHTIPVNYSSIERLSHHPYIRFSQAKAIYELRRKKIRLNNIQSLNELPELTPEQIQRLEPYLDFSH